MQRHVETPKRFLWFGSLNFQLPLTKSFSLLVLPKWDCAESSGDQMTLAPPKSSNPRATALPRRSPLYN